MAATTRRKHSGPAPGSALTEAAANVEDRLSPVAITTFENITNLWGLTTEQKVKLLGGIGRSTYFKFVKYPAAARLSYDTLQRASHVLGIFKALNILIPRKDSADTWVKRPNSASPFKGRSALDYMLQGDLEDIATVRRYLDGYRG